MDQERKQDWYCSYQTAQVGQREEDGSYHTAQIGLGDKKKEEQNMDSFDLDLIWIEIGVLKIQ